jgi:hypothetical protein
MWGRWSLRSKIVIVTVGVVFPVIAATTVFIKPGIRPLFLLFLSNNKVLKA